ncbi:MAG: NfeD family protein [Mucinivorans sp.]
MIWIILLVAVGLLLYFAELVLLPGITLAAVGSFCALAGASIWAFADYDTTFGWWILCSSIIGVGLITAIFLRPKTWKKYSLHTEIRESIGVALNERYKIGDRATALTRLAPMGNVLIDGATVEAKTRGGYLDAGSEVEIIGFENQSLVVSAIKSAIKPE